MRSQRRIHRLVLGAIAVAVFATIGASSAWAKAENSGSNAACPKNFGNFQEASNVGASIGVSGETATYRFESFVDQEPANGVPGLIKYCVYPPTAPDEVIAEAEGDNGEPWTEVQKKNKSSFSFVRPGGNPSNIGLDGTEEEMGTAKWSVPAPSEEEQDILLHINDPQECAALYPAGYEESPPETCFVLPGEPAECTGGDTGSEDFAYNAIPFHFCYPPPAIGFQATRTAEFGDAVELEGGGGELESLTVDLQSYACEEGFWNEGETNPCESPLEGEFEHPITAHFYEVGLGETVGAEIASAKQTDTFKIPYRPSADPTECPDLETPGEIEPNSKWKDPVSGLCVNSKSRLITFTYGPGITLPSQVIWTVSFNSSNGGYSPLAPQPCNEEPLAYPGGCPYDSLNVGDFSYENAPYAGTDLTEAVAFRAFGEPPGTLSPEGTWAGYRPLGQIKTR